MSTADDPMDGRFASIEVGEGLKASPRVGIVTTTHPTSVSYICESPMSRSMSIDAAGAEEAVRDAFERHYAPLLRLCFLLSGRRELAEDLVQDAFVRSIPRIGSLEREAVGPYLRRVAVNLWKNRLRRLAVEARSWTRHEEPSVHPDVEDPGGRDVLWEAVKSLPDRQRACIVLRYWEDLPVAEVAQVLGCSTGTVKSHTSRAVARLRREIGDED